MSEMVKRNDIVTLIDFIKNNWDASGECNSCGWHASLSEYDIPEDLNIDWNKGKVKLSCKSKDAEDSYRHRGITLYFDVIPLEPQAEMMPLIAIPSTCEEVHKWAKKQRDADMAWHNEKVQQVRKAFADMIFLTLPCSRIVPPQIVNRDYIEGAFAQYNLCLAHIRAMAGEVDHE
jgi:hypothetical protein